MAKDLYVYDVFDTEDECYVLENEPLGKVTERLKTEKTRVINAVTYGQKLDKRYIISRTYLDGTKNPNDAEEKVIVPENLRRRWDEARFAAKRALRNPKAVEKFLVNQHSNNKSKEAV
jgi:hypothetical protein